MPLEFIPERMSLMVTLSFIINLLGIQPYLSAKGINYQSLLAFCLVWGMGGAFISLGFSRVMAKWMMGVQVISPDERDPKLQDLMRRIHQLAGGAGLSTMPKVGIYDSPEINAFATGPSKSRSLVAISTGLLEHMNRNETEGVLAHEVAHIANGDMVTMTLIQGVVNAFAMFLSRAIAFAVAQIGGKDDERNEGGGFSSLTFIVTQIILEIIFIILGSIIVAWFSRKREYRADRGGATCTGREKMIAVLQALKNNYVSGAALVF
ncbi:MAG: protease HtpX [Oligoflexales bacterium]|nr:protease HtpX [Oligoflexales bacterium]